MSTTLVTLAADHVSGLLAQGMSLDKALAHARQRFGIDSKLILAEIEARHAFSLVVDEFETFDAARRWMNEGGK